jgi:hypothetical protein
VRWRWTLHKSCSGTATVMTLNPNIGPEDLLQMIASRPKICHFRWEPFA